MFGNPSYQITGLKPFTDNPFATIGNDWGFAKDFLGKDQLMQVKAIARDVSNKLRRDGWVGLYGIDVVFSRGRAYLLEINARQPASASFESVLQENGRRQENQVSVFEAHLGAILGVAPDFKMIKLNSGAQIIKRNTGSSLTETQKQKIVAELPGFNIIFYQNKKAESDQARCQTENTLIKKHGILNEQGEQVRKKFSWKNSKDLID